MLCARLPASASVRGLDRPLLAGQRPPRATRLIVSASSVPSRPSGGGMRILPQTAVADVDDSTAAGNSGTPAAAAPAPAAPTQVTVANDSLFVNSVLTPAQIYQKAAEAGGYKCAQPWWKIVLLGALAGAYVGLGGALLLTVGPNCTGIAASNPGLAKYITGAIGFPFALLQIIVCGSELFTGNTALAAAAVYEGKANIKGLAKNWVCSYLGNIIGCTFMLFLFANSGLLPQLTRGAEALAVYKMSAALPQTLIRAVCANWFVCLAVWQATAAHTMGGKFIACLGPISAFVCIGLEHCIANMFFVPLGIVCGAGVTLQQFITANLIPVTLGNIFAGVVCVATAYSLCYGSLGKKLMGQAA